MTILSMSHASKTYGSGHTEVQALKPTDFTVERGELVAIIGPSGSGKSTFLTLAGGLRQPTMGIVQINSIDVASLNERRRTLLRLEHIGFILQAANLVPYLNVDNQFRLLNRVKKNHLSPAEEEVLLKELDIFNLRSKYPAELSGGERQRVAIAKALYTDPDLILADEPTASLDSKRAFEVLAILSRETKEKNKATILVTHDQRMAGACDRVYSIVDGVLRKSDSKPTDRGAEQ